MVVLHYLTTEQIFKRLYTATSLVCRFNFEGQTFLHFMVTIEEKWIKDFESELKSRSNELRAPFFARPKHGHLILLTSIHVTDFCEEILKIKLISRISKPFLS
ncbi:hypothetical protein NPIL_47231 [Nephila pilipes]|uniref:Uncharacterized protein n=1 Tax=Nephila pilipes TaxID=299642 RepID=A0A8X6N2Z9_NEPPI|nr:hypothetical protein NPIL_681511 [Nephila pilipes]GFS91188.1 hypothetical protein NPIL_47231 [Nephila pilipes]